MAGDTDEKASHLLELEMRETPKESSRKEWASGDLLPRSNQRAGVIFRKAGRVALQVCANMKMRKKVTEEG